MYVNGVNGKLFFYSNSDYHEWKKIQGNHPVPVDIVSVAQYATKEMPLLLADNRNVKSIIFKEEDKDMFKLFNDIRK